MTCPPPAWWCGGRCRRWPPSLQPGREAVESGSKTWLPGVADDPMRPKLPGGVPPPGVQRVPRVFAVSSVSSPRLPRAAPSLPGTLSLNSASAKQG